MRTIRQPRRVRTSGRGYILLISLVVLTALFGLVLGLHQDASANRYAANVAAEQIIASSRAEAAAQFAIARVRGAGIDPFGCASGAPILNPNNPYPQLDGTDGTGFRSNCLNAGDNADFHSNGTTDPMNGGGAQWRYCVVCRGNPEGYVYVFAEGFYGSGPASPNFARSLVTVEMQVERGSFAGSGNAAMAGGYE